MESGPGQELQDALGKDQVLAQAPPNVVNLGIEIVATTAAGAKVSERGQGNGRQRTEGLYMFIVINKDKKGFFFF